MDQEPEPEPGHGYWYMTTPGQAHPSLPPLGTPLHPSTRTCTSTAPAVVSEAAVGLNNKASFK